MSKAPQSPPLFEFCLCADDFALSPAVSRGILEALAAGRLSATSAMTNQPSWPQAAQELRAGGFDADVGLHLNLTLGRPLTAMPQFAPATFPAIGRVMRAARKGDVPIAEIAAEIAAQIDTFAQAFGRPPDFVDGHQHVQILAGVRRSLFEVLEHKGLAGQVWLRSSSDRIDRILARRGHVEKALAVAFLGRGFAGAATARGFAVNDGFAGFSAFRADADYGADFARYLKAPGQRHLVMCHPGHVDAELAALDPVTTSREKELAFLLSPSFSETMDKAGVQLSRLTRILSRVTTLGA